MAECNIWQAIFEANSKKIGALIHAEPQVPQQVIETHFINMNYGKLIKLSKAKCIQHLIEEKR